MRSPMTPGRRRRAEALMLDTALVERLVGATTDPETGDVTDTYETVYEGPAKRQTYEPYEQTPEAGGSEFTVQRYAAHFPVGAFVPEVGLRVTWTASRLDPNLVGKVDRVVALLHKTAATAYRLGVESW